MGGSVIPIVEAGLTITPIVVDLAKRVIGLFHHAKKPADPGTPATAAGTTPLTTAQAQAMSSAAAATLQSLISAAVANGTLPASAAPAEALVPAILQVVYSLLPQTPAAATVATSTVDTISSLLRAYEALSTELKAVQVQTK